MKLQSTSFKAISTFLERVPRKSLRKGSGYYAEGAVESLKCVEPNQLYEAEVRGTYHYEVELEVENGKWLGFCTCPMEYDCKHVVAAILALQERAQIDDSEAVAAAPEKWKKNQKQRQASPLEAKLIEHLGRKLNRPELAWVAEVKALYVQAGHYPITVGRLMQLVSPPRNAYHNPWEHLNLWPDYPANDYLCWLHLAWELRRRQIPYPEFMEGITDLSLIEADMHRWHLSKEIQNWQSWFAKTASNPPAPEPVILDLRLEVNPTSANLQWRTSTNTDYSLSKRLTLNGLVNSIRRVN